MADKTSQSLLNFGNFDGAKEVKEMIAKGATLVVDDEEVLYESVDLFEPTNDINENVHSEVSKHPTSQAKQVLELDLDGNLVVVTTQSDSDVLTRKHDEDMSDQTKCTDNPDSSWKELAASDIEESSASLITKRNQDSPTVGEQSKASDEVSSLEAKRQKKEELDPHTYAKLVIRHTLGDLKNQDNFPIAAEFGKQLL